MASRRSVGSAGASVVCVLYLYQLEVARQPSFGLTSGKELDYKFTFTEVTKVHRGHEGVLCREY